MINFDFLKDSFHRFRDGLVMDGDSETVPAKKLIFVLICYSTILLTIGFSLYYFFFTPQYQAGLILLSATFIVILNLILFLYDKDLKVHGNFFLLISIFTPFLVRLFLPPGESAPLIWGAIVPIIAVMIYSYKAGLFWMMDYFVLIIIISFADRYFFSGVNVNLFDLSSILGQLNFLVFPLIFLFLLQYYTNKADKIGETNVANEELLKNLLPEEIAMRMKYEDKTITDSYDEVTVLFADMVGFTQLSSKLSPKELVDLLNVIFSALDGIIEDHGMEKIKTMGDAYMAAAGIPHALDNHAEIAADVALRFMEEVRKFSDMSGMDIKVRIGLHSGPVVAGVIGIKKTIYDLWGDTVNVAARMEHHGLPDRIQVTKEIYKHLKGKYSFISRGTIEVKGKGPMETYILLDKKKVYESQIGLNLIAMT